MTSVGRRKVRGGGRCRQMEGHPAYWLGVGHERRWWCSSTGWVLSHKMRLEVRLDTTIIAQHLALPEVFHINWIASLLAHTELYTTPHRTKQNTN